MHALMGELADLARSELLERIMPFWTGPALDKQEAGWVPWMANDLNVDRSQPQGLIVNTRLLWTFSAVYRQFPKDSYRQMAERAYEVVMRRFWDLEQGGAYWRLNSNWSLRDSAKKTYGQAFYVYALVEYYRAFGAQAALERATELFGLLEQHAHDAGHGGYWEVRARDWSESLDSRLSEKDQNEKKSMNNHLHVLEAFTALFQVCSNEAVERRLREVIGFFVQDIVDPETGHLRHFFDERWQVKSETYTYGHDIEASWLLCEAAEALGDASLQARIRELALAIARAVLAEGVDRDGGLFYEGRAGTVLDRGKEWWPQAEAAVGFLNAFELSGEQRFLDAAGQVWHFIRTKLADPKHGEWFWRINPDGRPDATLPKVSEWKGPYHGSRACLETLRRVDALSRHGKRQ